MPPARSASAPPSGRRSEPSAAPTATSVAASTFEIPYWSRKKIGRNEARPTNVPNVTAYRPHSRQASFSRRMARRSRGVTGLAGAGGSLARTANATHTSATGMSARPNTACQPYASREAGREQRGEHRAGVAGARDPHRQALALRRVVAAGERQGDREARARDAEQDADAEQGAVARRELPAGDEREDHEGHRAQADAARAVAIAEQAEHDPEDGRGEQRHGDHQALG